MFVFWFGCMSGDFYSSGNSLDELVLAGSEESNTVQAGAGEGEQNSVAAQGLSIETEDSCLSPCSFAVSGGGAVARVLYSADDWQIGESQNRSDGFAISYDFMQGGMRYIEAAAYDLQGNLLEVDRTKVDVYFNVAELVTASCPQECLLEAEASGEVERIRFYADGHLIGESSDPDFNLSYYFYQTGQRSIELQGLSSSGELLTTEQYSLLVGGGAAELPAVPYFYQYSNSSSPGSTCANTSVAMLLSYYGWQGVPDDLTYYYGVSTAQSPSGLASVFNQDAAYFGMSQSLVPTTSGTLSELRAELDAGRPVIVQGYFTSAGHVLVVLGYDSGGYWVNDPAGTWDQVFKGGYPYGWEPTGGQAVYYEKDSFELAITSTNGYNYEPIWMNVVR
jgi:hypothetical protein